MSEKLTIAAELREQKGTGSSRALRRQEKIPAVMYAKNAVPVHFALPTNVMTRLIHQKGFFTKIFDIQTKDKSYRAIAKDIQLHPVTDVLEHIDFIELKDGARVTVAVPIHFVKQELSAGIKKGGILSVIRTEIHLDCDVDHIPSEIEVDASQLEMGQTIHASDLVLPKGTKMQEQGKVTIASLLSPKVADDNAEEQSAQAS